MAGAGESESRRNGDMRSRDKQIRAQIIGYVLILLLARCSVELQHDLSEDQANEILVILQSNGVLAEKVQTGNDQNKTYALSVTRAQAQKAWQILKENDLPGRSEKGIEDIFTKNSLIPTATEERALYLEALQGELARTLKTMDGVINARVHIVLPEDSLFGEEVTQSKPKAAIFIKYTFRRDGSFPFKHNEIKSLVAGSVKGLETKDVEVIAKEINVWRIDTKYELVVFGPLKMTKESLPVLRLTGAVFAFLFLLLGVIIFIQTVQNHRLRNKIKSIQALHASREVRK